MSVLFLMLSLCSLAQAQGAAKPDPEELLKVSDRSRGAAASSQGLSWTTTVTSVENGESRTVGYTLKVRGTDAIAEVIAPARQKGEIILFNDRTLWFYKPGLRKPVSISARQKLVGQAANGDIASTNYARDYEAESVKDEKADGADAWLLALKAKASNVTYEKIRYWVSKSTKLAVKAEFLTVSGQVFKKATFKYGNSLVIKGKSFPFVSEMRIQDAFTAANVTTISYKSPKEESHSSSIFNVNNLIK